ncbi:amidinotransferase [Archangium gephyra]|nr:amidinotransferase [Archangium gephyra]
MRPAPLRPEPLPARSPVNIHNEWDPLEEIIVGSLEGMVIPPWEPGMAGPMYEPHFPLFKTQGGKPWPAELARKAEQELEGLARVLDAEGVKVRRPAKVDWSKNFSSPDWSSPSGLGAANPRDSLLVIGNEIIETPMAWRSRYFETLAFKPLLKEYWAAGAGWISAPRPQLHDDLYEKDFVQPKKGELGKFVLNDHEPIFDAADVIKCGRDIFMGLSSTCNHAGVEWLRRYLRDRHGDTYRVHELLFDDQHPMHIDATFYPLAPGKLLIHPERVVKVPELFKDWDVFRAPEPHIPDEHPLYFSSKWMNLNVLMIDEKRVIATQGEERTLELLKKKGFEPIPIPFWNFNNFGGSFHCATLDIRRQGSLQSYF